MLGLHIYTCEMIMWQCHCHDLLITVAVPRLVASWVVFWILKLQWHVHGTFETTGATDCTNVVVMRAHFLLSGAGRLWHVPIYQSVL